jgi:hypothetical protein
MQSRAKHYITADDYPKETGLELTLSYTWCEGNDETRDEPATASHPEDIEVIDVVMNCNGVKFFHVVDSQSKRGLLKEFNERISTDEAFRQRLQEACFEKEEELRQTALAERDEAKSRKWDE